MQLLDIIAFSLHYMPSMMLVTHSDNHASGVFGHCNLVYKYVILERPSLAWPLEGEVQGGAYSTDSSWQFKLKLSAPLPVATAL